MNSTSNTIHLKLRGYSDSIIARREVSSPLDALVREIKDRQNPECQLRSKI